MGLFTSTHLPHESLDYAFAAVLARTDVSGIGDGLAADQIAALRTCSQRRSCPSRAGPGRAVDQRAANRHIYRSDDQRLHGTDDEKRIIRRG
jgi:hypothetical protein